MYMHTSVEKEKVVFTIMLCVRAHTVNIRKDMEIKSRVSRKKSFGFVFPEFRNHKKIYDLFIRSDFPRHEGASHDNFICETFYDFHGFRTISVLY